MGVYKRFNQLQLKNERLEAVIESQKKQIEDLRRTNDEERERSKHWKAAAEAAKEESERRARVFERREDEFRNDIAELKNILKKKKEDNDELGKKLHDAMTKRNFLLNEAGWLTRRKYNKEFGDAI